MIWPHHRQFACQRRGGRGCVEIKVLRHKRREIPYCKVGTNRCILFADLMRYKHEIGADRRATLDQLTQDAQAPKMGY